MRVTVKLFGNEAKLAGQREVAIDLPDEQPTVASLRTALGQTVPELAAPAKDGRIAVNYEFAQDTTPLHSDDEVALIGPVSGG